MKRKQATRDRVTVLARAVEVGSRACRDSGRRPRHVASCAQAQSKNDSARVETMGSQTKAMGGGDGGSANSPGRLARRSQASSCGDEILDRLTAERAAVGTDRRRHDLVIKSYAP